MALTVACIVEGHGEVEAVPVVVRRIAQEALPSLAIKISPPFRLPRSRLLQPSELQRTVELAARRVGNFGGILILLDSDDDCPASMGHELLAWARKARADVPIRVVLAKREFEAWFLAAAESLRGRRGLAATLTSPSDPEAIRGAKEWLAAHMSEGHYSARLDQPALAALFDVSAARRAPSFDKFVRDVTSLLLEASQGAAEG
jgi:hypothetical protein